MSEIATEQLRIVTQNVISRERRVKNVALFDASGAVRVVPKQAAAQTDVGAVTSTVAAGATPTKAEFDALRTDALAVRTVLNSLLGKLRTAEILAT